jgi:glycosyltransferase involved in cell wall biosynthesis
VSRHLPSVSVVIPVRDDAVALERCLQALARQTVPPLEVVVVDNASSDDSAAVAARYGARVVPEPRPGIPMAAAAGYDAAVGEVIARCDADTVPTPRWLERLAGRLADGRLDAVTGVGRFYDLPRGVGWLTAFGYLGSYYLFTHLALGHTALWGSNMAVRRSAWVAVRDEVHRDAAEVHDDMDLAFVLGPGRRIRLDLRSSVGVSARSLHGRDQRRRRLRRARNTLEMNWADSPPWLRWRDRFNRPRTPRSAAG